MTKIGMKAIGKMTKNKEKAFNTKAEIDMKVNSKMVSNIASLVLLPM